MNPLNPTQLRHELHRYPELAFEEFKTTNIIIQNINCLNGADKLKIHTPMNSGLLVEYMVNDGGYFLFRADIDALPIQEKNKIDFKSTNNFMHACGHDIHSSILYAFISEVLQAVINQNILFLFQPAEEAGGGAIRFYETGIFNQFQIKHAFALHVTDDYPLGTIASTEGVLFASSLETDIEFIGENAHIAFPGKGRNAFNALRKFLDKSDKLKESYGETFIFGIGKCESGFVRNISPGLARLEGTIRGLNIEMVNNFFLEIRKKLEKVKVETGVDFKITRGAHYPEVIVDDKLYNKLSKSLSEKYSFIDCGCKMTSEDFGFYSQKYPSFMFWLGISKGENYGLHNPKFLPPDEVIEIGKNIFMNILNSDI